MRFTLQRGNVRLSACVHGPSGRDVACCVDVGVCGVAAGVAPEHRLALTVLRRAVAALCACLTGIRRLDFLDPPWRFLFHPGDEPAPALSEDAPVDPRLRPHVPARLDGGTSSRLSHVPDLQIFHPDHVKSPGEVGAGLLDPIFAPVCFACPQASDGCPHPATPVRSAATPGELSLQPLQPRLLVARSPGHAERTQVERAAEHGHTAVDPDGLAGPECRYRSGDSSECDVPPPRRVPTDPVRLGVRVLSRPAESDPASLRHQHPAPPLLSRSTRRACGPTIRNPSC